MDRRTPRIITENLFPLDGNLYRYLRVDM